MGMLSTLELVLVDGLSGDLRLTSSRTRQEYKESESSAGFDRSGLDKKPGDCGEPIKVGSGEEILRESEASSVLNEDVEATAKGC